MECTPRLAWLGTLIAALLAMLVPLRAHGCKPLRLQPVSLSQPLSEGVRLRSEALELRCRTPESLRCSVRATYRFRNPSDRATRSRVLVGSNGLHKPTIRGGTAVATDSADRQRWLATYGDESFGTDERALPLGWRALAPTAFDVQVPPGGEATVVLEATVERRLFDDGCSDSMIHTRHRLVSLGDRETQVNHLATDPNASLSIAIEMPRGWMVTGRQRRDRGHRSADGGRRFAVGYDRAPRETVLELERESRFVRGGPFLGAGIDLGDGPRARLRAGYELGLLKWWVQALAVETDLRSATVIPSTEIGTASVWRVFPSVGVGAGAPIRVYPDPRVGVRAQLTLSWPYFVSIVGTFDAYPQFAGRSSAFLGGILVQASF